MSLSILENSHWCELAGIWELRNNDNNRVLARLCKDKGLWYGRIAPKTTDHLVPYASLDKAMKQAEAQICKKACGD